MAVPSPSPNSTDGLEAAEWTLETSLQMEQISPHIMTESHYSWNQTDADILNFPIPKTFQSYLDITFLILFVIVGSLGNMMVIAVYLRNFRRKQSTANHFLCSLAVTDLMVCIAVIPAHIYIEVVMIVRRIHDFECKVIMVFWLQTLVCSSWILVGISIDRYYSICKPFDMGIQMRLVKCILFIIWLFSVIVAIPAVTYYKGPGCVYIPKQGTTARVFIVSWNSTLTLFLPLTIIIVAYIKIFSILSTRNRTARLQPGCNKVMQYTRYVVAKRLLLVICVYTLCWLPRTIIELFFAISTEPYSRLSFGIYVCTWIIPYMNSVLNPLLYSMINPTFRKQCWEIITCGCTKKVAYAAESWVQRASAHRFCGPQEQSSSLRAKPSQGTWV